MENQQKSPRKQVSELLDKAHAIAEENGLSFYAAVSDGKKFDDYIYGKTDKLVYLTIDVMKKRQDFTMVFATAVALMADKYENVKRLLGLAVSAFTARFGKVNY